jgi:hypothetical protein
VPEDTRIHDRVGAEGTDQAPSLPCKVGSRMPFAASLRSFYAQLIPGHHTRSQLLQPERLSGTACSPGWEEGACPAA